MLFLPSRCKARLEDYEAYQGFEQNVGLNPFRLEFYELLGICYNIVNFMKQSQITTIF